MDQSAILNLTRDYFRETHQKKKFVPGESYIPVAFQTNHEEDLVSLVSASLDLRLSAGERAKRFEERISDRFERKVSSLLVNSGSSANLVAISALCSPMMRTFGLKPLEKGDHVLTAACGFPTTVNPLFQNGLIPVFVDVSLRTLNVLLETLQEARTPKTRAVVLAHTLGNPYRADLVSEWCQKEGLYLVEDCCDAFGSKIGNRSVGSFGDYSTLSFYPAHHISMGEGGAVLPLNGKLRRVAESMRDWGRDCWCDPGKDNTCGKRYSWEMGSLPCGYDHKYIYSSLGYNLKATELQAAIGLSQLDQVNQFIEKRKENWKRLYDGVKRSPLLNEFLTPVEPTPGTDPSWFGFPVHCTERIDRRKLLSFLEEKRIGSRLVFGGNLTKQPAYRNRDYLIHRDLFETDRIMERTFWLGVHPGMDEEQVGYILESLLEGFKSLF